MTEKKYKNITVKEIKERIKNHELWLRGEENLNHDFSGLNLSSTDFFNLFSEGNFERSNFSNSIIGHEEGSFFYNFSFNNSSLKEADFKNTVILKHTDFIGCNLEGADFRNSIYDITIFNKEQRKQIIINDKDYEFYQEKKRLEEENKKLSREKIILEEKNQEKTKKLENVSDIQVNKLTESFEKLKKKFKREEIIWIYVSFVLFLSLLYFFSIPIFDMFLYSKIHYFIFYGILGIFFMIIFMVSTVLEIFEKNNLEEKEKITIKIKNFLINNKYNILKIILLTICLSLFFFNFNFFLDNINKPEKPLFNFSYYSFIPFGIILTTFLYFSVSQYSKAKKLRIENQNKVALLHGMIGIKADTDKEMDKNIFYQNVANIVFSKVYQSKEDNLPLDKIIELIKIINSNNKN